METQTYINHSSRLFVLINTQNKQYFYDIHSTVVPHLLNSS